MARVLKGNVNMYKTEVYSRQKLIAQTFEGPSVCLEEMLDAREHRASLQKDLLAHAPKNSSLLSMTLRIPGPHKSSYVLRHVFDAVRLAVDEALETLQSTTPIKLDGATGPEMLEIVKINADTLKRTMVDIEESHPLGSLVDLDVFDANSCELRPLSRTEIGYPVRSCLICGGPAKLCARSRTHSVEEMQEAIALIIQASFAQERGLKDRVY